MRSRQPVASPGRLRRPIASKLQRYSAALSHFLLDPWNAFGISERPVASELPDNCSGSKRQTEEEA